MRKPSCCRDCGHNDLTVFWRSEHQAVLCPECVVDRNRRAEADATPLVVAVSDLVRLSPAAQRALAALK